MRTHTFSVLVNNAPGVLARITQVFSRRGVNIEALAVGATDHPEVARLTLVTRVKDQEASIQLTRQLTKLIDVYELVELAQKSNREEQMTATLRCPASVFEAINDVVKLFGGRTVDIRKDSLTIEANGSSDQLKSLLDMLEPYASIELVKTSPSRNLTPLAVC